MWPKYIRITTTVVVALLLAPLAHAQLSFSGTVDGERRGDCPVKGAQPGGPARFTLRSNIFESGDIVTIRVERHEFFRGVDCEDLGPGSLVSVTGSLLDDGEFRAIDVTRRRGRWALKNRSYYDALLAEPRAARIRLAARPVAWSDEFEYSIEKGRRTVWEVTLGREIPLAGWQSVPLDDGGGDGRLLGAGEWGWGMWFPVSFHMIEDFKDDSNPIVNTDMRFGFMAKAQWSLTKDPRDCTSRQQATFLTGGDPGCATRTGHSISFRATPWAHESTHLGDEFTLLAANAFGDDFERINVSYEYWEYGVAYDALFGCTAIPERVTGACQRLTLRHGGIRPHTNKKIGYYSTETLGQNIPPITPSKENYEPSFGFEYRAPHKSGRLPRERGVVVSVDARHKILYDYHKVPADASEERQWSFSVVLGLSQPYGADDIPFDYFLYYYRGVNPHGQFRSRGDYQAFGLGFIFGG